MQLENLPQFTQTTAFSQRYLLGVKFLKYRKQFWFDFRRFWCSLQCGCITFTCSFIYGVDYYAIVNFNGVGTDFPVPAGLLYYPIHHWYTGS